MRHALLVPLLGVLLLACSKKKEDSAPPADGEKAARTLRIGLVLDVGGRGDHSFNDSALRGLELWAAGKRFEGGGYVAAKPEELAATIPPELSSREAKIAPLGSVEPLVLQGKSKQDYEPNLQLLLDEGAELAIGVGYMFESAIENVARRNRDAKLVMIDNQLQRQGKPYTLPNVRAVIFREEEGSFLVGALAAQASRTGKVGFVGGMEVELIQKFEAGFRAGVSAVNPSTQVLVNYTGSFDNITVGKQVAADLLSKGVDVIFHAAGADGLGVIKAVEEAHRAGKKVFVIGVDSDQFHVAPEVVLTSMLKRVDLAVYEAVRDLSAGKFTGGNVALGLKDHGVGYAPVRLDFPGKDAALAKVEALREQIASGGLRVPSHPSQLTSARGTP